MKKLLSIILSAVLLVFPLCVEAYASDDVNYDDLVAPCLTYVQTVTSRIESAALGFVNCTSFCKSLYTDKTVVITCTLQRKNNDVAWENYKSRTETFSGAGTFEVSKSWFAPSSYDYRVQTTVTVKNSSGTVIETATGASIILRK